MGNIPGRGPDVITFGNKKEQSTHPKSSKENYAETKEWYEKEVARLEKEWKETGNKSVKEILDEYKHWNYLFKKESEDMDEWEEKEHDKKMDEYDKWYDEEGEKMKKELEEDEANAKATGQEEVVNKKAFK